MANGIIVSQAVLPHIVFSHLNSKLSHSAMIGIMLQRQQLEIHNRHGKLLPSEMDLMVQDVPAVMASQVEVGMLG